MIVVVKYGLISTAHRSEAAARRAHGYSPAAIAITAGGNGSRGSRNGERSIDNNNNINTNIIIIIIIITSRSPLAATAAGAAAMATKNDFFF